MGFNEWKGFCLAFLSTSTALEYDGGFKKLSNENENFRQADVSKPQSHVREDAYAEKDDGETQKERIWTSKSSVARLQRGEASDSDL